MTTHEAGQRSSPSSRRCAQPIRIRTPNWNTRSAFELLIAVLLSAQATDVGVNKATRRLYPVANTPQKILALGVDG